MKVYEIITNKVIEQLKKGVVLWKQPWRTEWPKNFVTKKRYRGINVFLLMDKGYNCPYWATFKQINELGGRVKKGESGTIIVFWKLIEKKNEEKNRDADKEEEKIYIPLLRYYRVFNLEQTEGIDWDKSEKVQKLEAQLLENAEKIIENMPDKPVFEFGGNHAFYSPKLDKIQIPRRNKFNTTAGYYGTLFHELAHSTGHPKRLNRPGIANFDGFGSHQYSKEELIAEMTASFLLGHLGFQDDPEIENAAAYIGNWLENLENDSRLVIQAAAQAQKAADYILGIEEEEESREEAE